ncbi:uncharacterized protein [Narcine bancroftii]|uniref:uncharacterized protein n=1 Tax=Narcine bancroftii TaxID=1343680 RepID=UPI0038311AB4
MVIKCLQSIFSLCGYPSYMHMDRGAAFMSTDVQQYLRDMGIATSYNPRVNGLVEMENATIWKTVLLTLKAKDLPVARWQDVLLEALHSILSLLCAATNMTPHDRMFSFSRKATTGTVLPRWLMTPGPELLWKHCRCHRTDPLVEPVEVRHRKTLWPPGISHQQDFQLNSLNNIIFSKGTQSFIWTSKIRKVPKSDKWGERRQKSEIRNTLYPKGSG